MAYNIEEKLVIGVASSALFRLDEADTIFRSNGIAAYREYQRAHTGNTSGRISRMFCRQGSRIPSSNVFCI